MSTSGTVGQTVADVTTLIEHAFRRCGKIPSTVSGEQLLAARESLFFLLTDLVNDGISLWCIQKTPLPVRAGAAVYPLPVGVADVINVSYRTLTEVPGGTAIAGTGWVGLQFASAVSPTNVTVEFTASVTPSLVVESSGDSGATWQAKATFPVAYTALPIGQRLACDVDNPESAAYWRIRDTSGTLGAGASVVLGYNPTEIPMYGFNKDDYFNLPNKTFQSNRSLQYWFDKQIAPQLWLWPVPSASVDQIVAQTHRQIQDVGSFTNTVEVPQRWYEYVIFALSCRVALELPKGELPPGRLEHLEGKAAEHLNKAADGESDGAPLKLQPNLRGYT